MANTFRNLEECVVLPVGTEVSAKFKGAFCEAVIESVNKNIEIKVVEHATQKLFALSDSDVQGCVEVGRAVKFAVGGQQFEGIVKKITDKSVYTVVFNDGDESYLKRNSLCLKGERNFSVPKTSNSACYEPTMNKDRTRSKSSDTACSKETMQPYKVGSVVIIEMENQCFPALVLARISGDTLCVRNFIDGEDFHVNIKNVTEEFDLSKSDLIGKKIPYEALCNAENYIKRNEIPETWSPLHEVLASESSSEDENFESKDSFIADVLHYFEDRGTPLNQEFNINGHDLDVHKLYKLVKKLGGFVKVTNKGLWKSIYIRMGLPLEGDVGELMKNAYKTYLYDFAELKKKLGCSLVPSITADTKRSRKFPKERFNAEVQPKKKGKRTIGDKRNGSSSSFSVSAPVSDSNPDRSVVRAESSSRVSMNPNLVLKDHSSDASLPDVAHTSNDLAIGSSRCLDDVAPQTGVRGVAEVNVAESGDKLDRPRESGITSERTNKDDESVPKRKRKSTDLAGRTGQHKLTKRPGKKRDLNRVSVRHSSDELLTPSKKKFDFNDIPLKSIVKVLWCGSGNGEQIYKAKVIVKNPNANAVLVHYVGWNSRHDQWISPDAILEIDSSPCNRYNSSSSDSLVHSNRSVSSTSFPSRSLSVIEPSRLSSTDSVVNESNLSLPADTSSQTNLQREQESESAAFVGIRDECASLLDEMTASCSNIKLLIDEIVIPACDINDSLSSIEGPVQPYILSKDFFSSTNCNYLSASTTDELIVNDPVSSVFSDAGVFESNLRFSDESQCAYADLPTAKSNNVDAISAGTSAEEMPFQVIERVSSVDPLLFLGMPSNELLEKESNEIATSEQSHSQQDIEVPNPICIVGDQPALNEAEDKNTNLEESILNEIENCQTCANMSLLPDSEVLSRLDKLLPKENRLSLEYLDSFGIMQDIPGCTPGESALVRAQYFHKRLSELLAATENSMLMELRMKAHQNKHHDKR